MCSHFHWTVDYILWGGVSWVTLQKMLIDGPRYTAPGSDDKGKPGKNKPKNLKKLADLNAEQLMNFVNGLPE